MGFLSRYITSETKSALRSLLRDLIQWLQSLLESDMEAASDSPLEWEKTYKEGVKKYQTEPAKETARKAHDALSGRR